MVKGLFASLLVLGVCTSIAPQAASAAFIDARGSVVETEIAFKGAALEDVLAGVVPSNVVLTYQNEAVRKAVVTIKAKGTWDVLVRNAAAQAGVLAKIDTEKNTVVISSNGPAVDAARIAVDTSVGAKTLVAKARPTTAVAAMPGAHYGVEVTDGRVSKTVDRWAKLAGMQMVWEPSDVDYPIEAAANFGTDLRGALGSLFAALRGTETPLRACVYNNQPNSVIRVIRASAHCKED